MGTGQRHRDDFVPKPFREETIFEKLTEFLGVRYLYEESDEPARGVEGEGEVALERMAVLPAEWLARLKEAANRGSIQGATRVIGWIRERDVGVADRLEAMIWSFSFEEVVGLVERVARRQATATASRREGFGRNRRCLATADHRGH